jgi:NADH-quinone oxidoreductase subunit C
MTTDGSPESSTPAVAEPVVPIGAQSLDVIGVRTGSFGVSDSGDTSGFGGLVEPIVMPGPTLPPFGDGLDEVYEELVLSLDARGLPVPAVIEKAVVHCGELTVFVAREHLPAFATTLRDEPGLMFELCLGVNGVHYPDEEGRELHAVYPFLSITHNRRLRVEVVAPDADPHIPSIVGVYPANDWHERETWDFFGIVFDGHPALTRIMMPDDWPGHPQRKDYPLGGIPVEYKGATVPAPDQRRAYN